jgi:O-antigen/teichoic acid export membrane protein
MKATSGLAASLRAVAVTAVAQAGAQAFAFGAGIVVIRSLGTEQYAYYTIATAALGMMTVLADSGITNGVLAQAGPLWQDRQRLAAVIAAGVDIRRRLALVAIAIAVPLLIALLRHQGADWLTAAVVTISVLPTFMSVVSGQLFESVPRLHQRIIQLQAVQLGNNVGRFLGLLIAVPRWPFAAVASLVSAVPQLVATRQLRKLAERDAASDVPADGEAKRQLVKQLQRTMPGAIYYALSGQLTVWLITLFGHRASVAAVGALGRLAAVMALVTAVFNVVAVPRFARIPKAQAKLAVRRFHQSLTLLTVACLLPIAALAAFPVAVLSVLGPHYQGLAHEAVLMGVSAVASTVAGAAFGLAAARGIVAPPLLSVPFSILLQVVLILTLPLDTVAGVIYVGLYGAIGQCLLHAAYFALRARQ